VSQKRKKVANVDQTAFAQPSPTVSVVALGFLQRAGLEEKPPAVRDLAIQSDAGMPSRHSRPANAARNRRDGLFSSRSRKDRRRL
jgi:hypothetical protein